MDLLKRSLAPITDAAWSMIDAAVAQTLRSCLTARTVVDVVGPKGWATSAVGEGRLDVGKGPKKGEVSWGVHRVRPLVEARITFLLSVWELDNAVRGAQDVDLEAAEEAARKMAAFEDGAVFNGFEAGSIGGLADACPYETIPLGAEPQGILDAVSNGLVTLQDAAVGGPFALVLGNGAYRRLMGSTAGGQPLVRVVEKLIDGRVTYCPVLTGGFLVSRRGGDLELTIGQDLSVGYEMHDTKEVRLFLAESFTFQVIDPAVVIAFS
jgi:uncharacterized linocin/CFP29 family protein